jgi:hypothetical protein
MPAPQYNEGTDNGCDDAGTLTKAIQVDRAAEKLPSRSACVAFILPINERPPAVVGLEQRQDPRIPSIRSAIVAPSDRARNLAHNG